MFRHTTFDDDHGKTSSMDDDASKLYGYMENANQEIYDGYNFR